MIKIICEIDMFSQARVSILDETDREFLGYVNIPEVAKFVTDLCYSKKIHEVVLTGSLIFATEIMGDINKISKEKYENFDIKVEVK